MDERLILHLIPAPAYAALAADAPVRNASLETEGFLHCTRGLALMLEVANRFYQAVPGDFLVLVIDPDKVRAPVRFEPPTSSADPLAGQLFPHIYGPLNRDAIVAVRTARRASDGTFLEV